MTPRVKSFEFGTDVSYKEFGVICFFTKQTLLQSFSEANIAVSINDQMGGNQAAEEVDTPKQGKPVSSTALTLFRDENLSVGEPWSTGLFDCHENQTNGIFLFVEFYVFSFLPNCTCFINWCNTANF